ncbi:MAG: vitamin K epoxide reductase family protein, partial [Thermomicrobiales bacterium]
LYLTLYQINVIGSVWEPFFGNGSKKILDSSLATSLPIPDALLGVIAYLVEVVLDLAGGEDRWHRRPWLTIAFGVVVIGMAAGSVGLVLMQAFYFQAFCTFCLVSAAISFVIAGLALGEPRASLRHLRGR